MPVYIEANLLPVVKELQKEATKLSELIYEGQGSTSDATFLIGTLGGAISALVILLETEANREK